MYEHPEFHKEQTETMMRISLERELTAAMPEGFVLTEPDPGKELYDSFGFYGRDLTTAQTGPNLNGKTISISRSSGCVYISTLFLASPPLTVRVKRLLTAVYGTASQPITPMWSRSARFPPAVEGAFQRRSYMKR